METAAILATIASAIIVPISGAIFHTRRHTAELERVAAMRANLAALGIKTQHLNNYTEALADKVDEYYKGKKAGSIGGDIVFAYVLLVLAIGGSIYALFTLDQFHAIPSATLVLAVFLFVPLVSGHRYGQLHQPLSGRSQ